MKTLHKLLTGTLLVALTAFGLTALSSPSTDSTEVMVAAFTNETCDSELFMVFQNIGDMLDYDGTTDNWGNTWNFESYYHLEDFQESDNPECRQVSVLTREPTVESSGTAWIRIPYGAQGGGAGGSGGGGEGGGGTPPKKEEPQLKFDNQNARELRDCLQKKLAALAADGTLKKVEGVGCFNDTNIKINLDYKKTNFDWIADHSVTQGLMGATVYTNTVPNSDVPDNTVFLYPKSILNTVNTFNANWESVGRKLDFDNLTGHAALDEMVHTIQGYNAKQADSNWENPKPYEMRAWQIQANIVSFSWYKQLHNDKNPPVQQYTESIVNQHYDHKCNLTGDFLTNKQEYQKIEEQIANNQPYDNSKKEELETYFKNDLLGLPTNISGAYDYDAELECD